MKFAFIEQHASAWPVNVMCRMLGVSRSGYYDWRGRAPSARVTANLALLGDVRRLQARHQGRYGSPRMHAALRAEGHGCSRGRVERLMRRTASARSPAAGSGPAPPTAVIIWRSLLTGSHSASRLPRRTGYGSPISPTSPPARAGCIWPPYSTWRPARSSAGPCVITCAPSCRSRR